MLLTKLHVFPKERSLDFKPIFAKDYIIIIKDEYKDDTIELGQHNWLRPTLKSGRLRPTRKGN